jgi:hypothetical protein
MMKRKQIQLTARQAQALSREAARRGVSDAAVIRSLVDELLPGNERATNERWERALAVVGRFRSGRRDIGRNHDRYLAEDFDD